MKPTQEQVIAWAQLSGIDVHTWMGVPDLALLTFATLAYEAGRKDENEACAKVIEHDCHDDMTRAEEADAIRARREQ